MGISGAIGLSMFLFGLEWDIIMGIQEDVSTIREDIGYIKGTIESWDQEFYQNLTNP